MSFQDSFLIAKTEPESKTIFNRNIFDENVAKLEKIVYECFWEAGFWEPGLWDECRNFNKTLKTLEK